ncbi:MAG: hypothetical protein ACT4PL_08215 [Phycisphaerales bacterium]
MDWTHRRVLVVLSAAGLAGTWNAGAMAQAPAAAQVWDVAFVVDESGPLAAGPFATAVGITIKARVAIRPNTVNNANFGVFRVGGVNSAGFRMTFDDPGVSASEQGGLSLGLTNEVQGAGEMLTDLDGAALAGHFAPFRGSSTITRNTSPGNGTFGVEGTGAPFVTDISGSRSGSFAGALGVATESVPGGPLVGEYAEVYRLVYVPREGLTGAGLLSRTVTVTVRNLSVRYIHTVNGSSLSVSPVLGLADRTFSFTIPGPGAGVLLAGAWAWGMRRQRGVPVSAAKKG